jgi:hypothetical protein
MSEFSRVALLCTASILLAGAVTAQVDDDKVFNLSTSGVTEVVVDSVVTVTRFEPRIEPGKFEVSLSLGFLGLTKTLLQHDQMIYKATAELFYYGDVALKGQSAFTPFLHVGYNLNTYLAVEAQLGISFSEYNSVIENAHAVNPEGGSPVNVDEVGEFDPEHRSVLGVFTNVNAVLYPFSFRNQGKGRWHPYVTAGVGRAKYDMDSNYTDDAASAFSTDIGAGIRFIADDLISIRFEILEMIHTIEFAPAEYFDTQEEGTVVVPVYEFAPSGWYTPIESFESQSLGGLVWTLGVTASF